MGSTPESEGRTMNNLTITTREQTGSTVITVSGEIDLASCPVLEQATRCTPADGAQLRLDMSGVTFMDSCGLNLLLRLHRRLTDDGSRLVLTGVRDEPMRILNLTGADTVLHLDAGDPRPPVPRPVASA
jgi:anti-sigma B factor antagonist